VTSGADAAELKARLTDPRQVCTALGLLDGYKPDRQAGGGLIIRCPSHNEKNPSCSVRRGRDGTLQVRCFSCDFKGDVFDLIAAAGGIDRRTNFPAVIQEAARLDGGYVVGSSSNNHPRPPPEPPPPPQYPPAHEVLELWEACGRVTDDEQARAYLAGRSIDPEWVALLDLARVLPATAPAPSWASFRGKPWGQAGFRLIFPMVDHTGELRSLRAGVVGPIEGNAPKRVAPAGYAVVGLVMACPTARGLLAAGAAQTPASPPAPLDVVISEGEPDFLTHATRAEGEASIAVLGVVASAWNDATASRLPDGARIVIRTDRDPAGDRYAADIRDSLAWRAERVEILDFPRPSDPSRKLPDDNELAQRGELGSYLDNMATVAPRSSDDGNGKPNVATPAIDWPAPGGLVLQMQSAPARLPTGLDPIDTGWRGGAPAGLLWVVGGAPGAGKTSLATWLAHGWAQRGIPVAYIAGDEPRDGILIRLGQQHGLDRKSLEGGYPVALSDLAAHLDTLPLTVLDPDNDRGINLPAVAAELRRRYPEGPAVLVVDSLQAVARRITDDVADSPRAKTEAAVRECKAIAKQHGLLLVALSELARGAYRGGPDQTNDLAAAKESGAIEYECGALCVLRPVEGDPGLVAVSWAKARPGRVEPFSLRQCHARASFAVETGEAQGKGQSQEATHGELLDLVINLVKRTPGIAGANAICARLANTRKGQRKSDVLAAVRELLDLGTLDNQGSKARPRLYLAANQAPPAPQANEGEPPAPTPDPPPNGSGGSGGSRGGTSPPDGEAVGVGNGVPRTPLTPSLYSNGSGGSGGSQTVPEPFASEAISRSSKMVPTPRRGGEPFAEPIAGGAGTGESPPSLREPFVGVTPPLDGPLAPAPTSTPPPVSGVASVQPANDPPPVALANLPEEVDDFPVEEAKGGGG